MREKTFTLHEDHITLLRKMYVGWQYCETGAPEIDPKRPYGNGDVARDIIEMLDWKDLDNMEDEESDDFYESDEYEELRYQAMTLHEQTEIALQIILQTGSFVVGDYVNKSEYGLQWELV